MWYTIFFPTLFTVSIILCFRIILERAYFAPVFSKSVIIANKHLTMVHTWIFYHFYCFTFFKYFQHNFRGGPFCPGGLFCPAHPYIYVKQVYLPIQTKECEVKILKALNIKIHVLLSLSKELMKRDLSKSRNATSVLLTFYSSCDWLRFFSNLRSSSWRRGGLLNVCQFKGYDLSQYIILVLPTWQDGLHTIGLKDWSGPIYLILVFPTW